MPGSTYIKAEKAHHTNASPTYLPYTSRSQPAYPTLTARFTPRPPCTTHTNIPAPPQPAYPTPPAPNQPTLPYASPQPTYPTPAYLPYTTLHHTHRPISQPTYPTAPSLQRSILQRSIPSLPGSPTLYPFPGTTHKMRRPRQSSHAGYLCLADQRADSAARHILAPTSLPYTRPSPDKSKPRPSTGAEIRPSPPTLQPHQSPPRKAP